MVLFSVAILFTYKENVYYHHLPFLLYSWHFVHREPMLMLFFLYLPILQGGA